MKKIVLFYFLLIMPVNAGSNVYIEQVGNHNNVYIVQTDSDGKNINIVNEGDLNIMSVLQQGAGSHTANISSTVTNTGNNTNNLLEINQRGAGNHTANIIFNNGPSGSSNNDIKLNQSGAANKHFSLTLQGNGIGFVGIQDNFITPDSASMSITCLTPPCSGYSYIKR